MYSTTKLWLLCLAAFTVLMGLKCKKEYPFPDETKVGMNTFGCKVDGQIFVPNGNRFRARELECAYTLHSGDRYDFAIWAVDNSRAGAVSAMGLGGDSIELVKGTRYSLVQRGNDHYFGDCLLLAGGKLYSTSNIARGELFITEFDTSHNIVAGTFWFTAIDTATGQSVNVTDGRFDMKFNQP